MSTVLFDTDGEVAIVTIDRPEVRNAVNDPTAAALVDAFRRFEADPALAVAVLTGAGGTFCAGADLKAAVAGQLRRGAMVSDGNDIGISEAGDGPMGPSRLLLEKPVIAAVEGYAVAGGLELALWCDLRVAAVDAVFGVFCRRWGVPLVDLGTVRLPRLIGHSHAMDMILTGRGVAGEEALRMGLVNRLVERGRARAAAIELAHQLARFPQRCLRADRLSAYEQWGMPFEQAMRNEFRHGAEVVRSGETLAGASRFAAGAGRHGSFEPGGGR